MPGARRIVEQEARHRRQRVLVDDIDAARTRDPAEVGVEHDQGHQSQPEDRDRIADQPHDANDLVDHAAAPHRGPYAERHADPGTDDDAERGELERRRERAPDVLHHGVRRQHRRAEIALQDLAT